MTRAVGRARELFVDLCLAGTTAVALLREDPLLAVVQASRRLPARAVRVAVRLLSARGRGTGLRAATAAWLAGSPAAAVAALEGTRSRGTGPRAAVLAELAGQLHRPDLAARLAPRRSVLAQARAAWLLGDLDRAVDLLAEAGAAPAVRARYDDHRRLLQPSALPVPGAAQAGLVRRAAGGGAPGVLHVLTNSLPHTQSGYTVRSHEVLRAQQRAGLRVSAVTRVGYPVTVGVLAARRRDVVDGVAYDRLTPLRTARTTSARLDQQVRMLDPLVRRRAPAVLHTTTDWTNAVVTEAVARRSGLPWVYEVRGLLEDTWVASHHGPQAQARAAASQRYRLTRDKETELVRRADHVVTLSRTLRDELVSRGVDPVLTTVVPNSVDPSLLASTQAAADAREEAGLPRQGYWVGTVSSIVEYEGLDTLVDAVAELRRRGVDARLAVVGDGVSRSALRERADAAGLGPHAVFTGRVARHESALLHRCLDVFALPRRDLRVCRYVSPLKPVEAMASARPVVASDLPVLAELVGEPGSGVLVPPEDPGALADALGRLADDRALREELGAAGRRFAAGRTWQGAGTAYRALYERLVA